MLAGLEANDRDELLGYTRQRRFAKGDVVFHEGDPADSLHLVASGRFAVRVTTPLGDRATLSVVGPGDWFGELAIVSDVPRNATVAALEPAQTLALNRTRVDEIRGRDPSVDHVLLSAVVDELRRTSSRLLEALYLPVETRVMRRVCDMERVYRDGSGATVIPLTQDDIAQLAGATRPTVNRVLRAAAADGIIALRRGRIEIRDHDRLLTAAD